MSRAVQTERVEPRAAGLAAGGGERISLLGVPLDKLTMAEAVRAIVDRLDAAEPSQVCFVNADCINIAWRNTRYRKLLERSSLNLADGMGLKVAALALGCPVPENVNGTDLFPLLCEALCGTGKRVYLLGARPGVAQATCRWIASHYPALELAGCHHGYFPPDQEQAVVESIASSGADLLLVAFGVPRQELWIDRHLDALGVKVAMGVGGLFDFYSGRIRRAPRWVRRVGMEWLYRLYQEPGRLWRRYLLGNPLFLARVGLHVAKQVIDWRMRFLA